MVRRRRAPSLLAGAVVAATAILVTVTSPTCAFTPVSPGVAGARWRPQAHQLKSPSSLCQPLWQARASAAASAPRHRSSSASSGGALSPRLVPGGTCTSYRLLSPLRAGGESEVPSGKGGDRDANWVRRVVQTLATVLTRLLMWLGLNKGGGRSSAAARDSTSRAWAGLFRAPAKEEASTASKRVRALLRKPATWLALVVVLLIVRGLVAGPASRMVPPAEVPMSEFLRITAGKGKATAAMTGLKVTTRGKILYELAGRPHFTRQVPLSNPLLEHLVRHGVNFGAAEAEPVGRAVILAQLFPLAWLGMMYFVLKRNMGETVGSAGRQVQGDTLDRSLTFDDVAGIDEAKAEVRELVSILRDPSPYVAAGARLPSGVMLVGPPGTGKTLLARVMAAEAGVPYYYCSGSDFVEMFVGRGAARVRKLFARAAKTAPCIVFFDELDALGKQRSMGASRGSNDEAEQTLNQLLACMDGLDTNNNGVIVVAATNRFDMLDDALTRPGRFDRIVRVGVPEEAGRQAILKVHTRNMQLEDPSLLATVAAITPGLTGAELASVANEAAIRAARRGCVQVSQDDFQGAVRTYYTSRSKLPANLHNLMKGLLN